MSDTAPAGRFHRYSAPRSRIVQRDVTKEYGRRLIAEGMFPRGCIWCPGTPGERPDIGDIYDPDPNWKPSSRILTRDEEIMKAEPAADQRAAVNEGWNHDTF